MVAAEAGGTASSEKEGMRTVSTSTARWSGLDGLRAIAVVAVVAFHFDPGLLPGGFLGVDVFFVLSGYLITRMLVSEFAATERIDFSRFYLRRARRLLPAVGALLVVGLAVSLIWRDQLATIRQATAAAAGYVSNWWLAFAHHSYFVSAGRPSMLQHLWSLAVEEQFYLIWPVVALFVLRARGGAGEPGRAVRRLAATATVLAVLSTTLMAVLAVADDVPYGSDGSRLYYGTDTHSMGLLLGAAAGALAADRLRRPRPIAWRFVWATDTAAALAVAGTIVIFCVAGQYDGWLYRGGFLAVAAVACVAVSAVARRGSRVGRLLDVTPLRWIAARSYAIYLWHWPIAVVTRPGVDLAWPTLLVQLVRVVVTVGLADVTYRFLEHPIRTLGFHAALGNGRARVARMFSGRAPVGARLIGVAALGTIVLAGAVLVAAPAPPTSAAQRALGSTTGGRSLKLGPEPASRHTAGPLTAAPGSATPGSATPTAPGRAAHVAPPLDLPPRATSMASSSAPVHTTTKKQRTTRPQPVSAFGDSVMLGARQMLSRHFPGGTLDAVEGRQPAPILNDVLTEAAHRKLHQVVIIGVGDNGLIDPGSLRQTLARLRGYHVIVINNRVDRPWEGPNNRTIAQAVSKFGNVRLLDWHRQSSGHPSWFYDDGIHLTPAGARAYSAMLAALAG